MDAMDHVNAADRILDTRMRQETRSPDLFEAANSNARIALALAVIDLAAAAKTDAEPAPINQDPWPAGVTARILTRIGLRSRDLADATVDIHDDDRSTARCRPCGWTKDHGLPYRAEVLAWAQDHADQCTALPNPAA